MPYKSGIEVAYLIKEGKAMGKYNKDMKVFLLTGEMMNDIKGMIKKKYGDVILFDEIL